MHVLTDSGNWALLSIFKADLIDAHKVLHFDDLLSISVWSEIENINDNWTPCDHYNNTKISN